MFREQDRAAARTLAIALRGMKGKEKFSFPGFQALFKSEFVIDGNPLILPDLTDASMAAAVEAVKAAEGERRVLPAGAGRSRGGRQRLPRSQGRLLARGDPLAGLHAAGNPGRVFPQVGDRKHRPPGLLQGRRSALEGEAVVGADAHHRHQPIAQTEGGVPHADGREVLRVQCDDRQQRSVPEHPGPWRLGESGRVPEAAPGHPEGRPD